MTDAEELERLRARVAELESELQRAGPEPAAPAPAGSRWRSVSAIVLITLACILAPFAVTSVWASTQVSNTDRYVETVAPLVNDPDVQAAIATDVTTAILANIDIRGVTTDALTNLADQPNVPPRVAAALPGLAVPITNGVQGFIGDQVDRIVAGPRFAALWDRVNRTAHAQLVKLLEGNQGGAVTAQGNTVTLNLAPIIAQVKQRLVASGFSLASKIPTVNKTFVLVKSEAVTKAQGLYRLLNTLGVWLPIITLALFAGGIALARKRRRALAASGFALAGSMLVLGIGLAVARLLYLNAVPADVLPQQAASDVFDTIVRFLRYSLRAVAVAGLIVGLGAFLTGPGTAAVRTRSAFARGIGWLRGSAEGAGMRTGVVGSWTYAHKRWLRIGTVIAGALVLVFWTQPTVAVILWTTAIVLVVLALIEFLGRPPAEPVPAAEAPGPAVPRQMERVPPERPSSEPVPAEQAPETAPQAAGPPTEQEKTPHG